MEELLSTEVPTSQLLPSATLLPRQVAGIWYELPVIIKYYVPISDISVTLTFPSMSLSHKSLIMQAAPRIRNDPIPNRASILNDGNEAGSVARAMPQVQGQ